MPDEPQREAQPSPDPSGGPASFRTAHPAATASRPPAPPGFIPPFLTPGLRPLSEYELLHPVGRGSFGEVWKASGPGGIEVALKFIRLGDEAGAVELRALELMKGIRHAHLLPLFGAWQRADLLILAMELADRTLYQRWKEAHDGGQPGIPAPELLEYMRESAKGLDYLNDQRHSLSDGRVVGIQHKDVKPQNLLLVGGTVKVGDFGLARLLERTVTAASGSMTPAYTAPEFLRGQATRWSDQYCLAVTYCQLRGGRLPFEGGAPEVMAGHALYAPDLSMVPATERLALARALAKEPDQRWPSCREFVRALATTADPGRITFSLPPGSPAPADLLADPPAATVVAPRRRRWGRWVAPAAAAVIVLGLAAVAFGVWASRSQRGDDGASPVNSAAAVVAEPPVVPTPPATTEAPSRPRPTERAAVRPTEPATVRPTERVPVRPTERATVRRPVETHAEAVTHRAPRPTEKARPVPRPQPPAVLRLTVADPVRVETGKSATLSVNLRRENCSGPVRLDVEGLPAKVHAQAVTLEPGQDTARVEIRADEDAEGGPAVARVRARLGETRAEQEWRLAVLVTPLLKLVPPAAITLEAGQTRTVVFRLRRKRVAGPVEVRLEGLHPGVTCRPVTVAENDVGGRLEIETSADAPRDNRTARLVGDIAGAPKAEAPVQFTIGPSRPFKVRLKEDTAIAVHSPEDPVVWLNRGHTYREAGEADKARADYSHAIRLEDEYPPAYYYRGRAYQDEKRYDRALQDYDEAIRLDPKFAPTYFQRGVLRMLTGDAERAVADYGKALEIAPDFTAAYRKRAEAWKAMKLNDRALEDYDRALRLDPDSAAAHFERGVIHHLLKQDAQAIIDYDAALRLGPKLAAIYLARGNAWRARKDAEKALADYDEAIRRDPGLGAAYYNRGRLYEEKGNTDGAREDLTKARRLGVGSE